MPKNQPPPDWKPWTPPVAAAPVKPAWETAADAAQTEGFRLRDAEDANQAKSLDFAQGEFNRWTQHEAVTDDEINTRFGMAGEQAGADANTAYGNARAALGEGGFTSGSGAALVGQIESARLGQLTGAARDLRLYKARQDTDKAMQRLQASSQLADRMNQSPSALGLDVLGQRAGLEVTMEGIRSSERAANAASKAQKKAGKASAAGNVFSTVASFV